MSRIVAGVDVAESRFPDDLIAEARRRYGRPTREHPQFSQHRRAGRSFPTDYSVSAAPGDLTTFEHIQQVAAELGVHRTSLGQARWSTHADMRVFAGPSDADAAALPYIDDAWHIAEYICDNLGLRTDAWSRNGLAHAHLRYGLMLDWATRRRAAARA